jgi:hypothetical protein
MKIKGSLCIFIVCLTSILVIHYASVSARIEGKPINLDRDQFPVYVVKTTGDINMLWEEKQVTGRIIVHLGKFLHYVAPKETDGSIKSRLQSVAMKARSYSHSEVENYKSYLWFAFHENIGREIYNVMPRADYVNLFDFKETEIFQDKVIDYDFESPRVITSALPSIQEPVLLNIDASFFGLADAGTLLTSLMKSGLKPDIITICLSEDNPDVTETERKQVTSFVQHLPERVKIIPYSALTKTAAISK